uniref:Uncharacterized protein n=1 Tax=Sus scrofa TaxID=9823 RepID=A0A8D1LDT6_PIG
MTSKSTHCFSPIFLLYAYKCKFCILARVSNLLNCQIFNTHDTKFTPLFIKPKNYIESSLHCWNAEIFIKFISGKEFCFSAIDSWVQSVLQSFLPNTKKRKQGN